MQSLMHDSAMQLARAIVAMVAPCLREEEQRELFGMVYDAVMDALKRYEEKADRRTRRIHPSSN